MTTLLQSGTITPDELLDEIIQDVVRLKYGWDNFRYLYAAEESNVDVLNAAGPGLFSSIQRLMFDDAILRICRLTDPAGNRHQENLSLERMLDATSWKTTDPAKWQTYRTKLDQLEDVCEPCRIHRNKRVSHKDIASLQNLPVATMKMIDDASASIQGFVGAIYSELNHGSAYSFNMLIDGDRDVKRFMRYLRNRASQSRPEAVSRILYSPGQPLAAFQCAFCDSTDEDFHFYPQGEPSPTFLLRRHYEDCHGVVGCETITVETFDRTETQPSKRFVVDLRKPARERT